MAVYTWNFHAHLVREARRLGASGYLSKALPARDLVAAIEALHAGEVVISDPPGKARGASGHAWPGRAEGLSDREAEILALITQGKNNAEIAGLTYLSPNTVKSYVRNLYRKIDVSSRTQAVLWGYDTASIPTTTASSTGKEAPDRGSVGRRVEARGLAITLGWRWPSVDAPRSGSISMRLQGSPIFSPHPQPAVTVPFERHLDGAARAGLDGLVGEQVLEPHRLLGLQLELAW